MKIFKHIQYEQLVVAAVFLSLVYNFLWLLLFVLAVRFLPEELAVLSLVFLLGYLLLALPVKDQFFLALFKKYILGNRPQASLIEKKLNYLQTPAEIESFLAELVKVWNLDGLRLFLYIPEPRILYLSAAGRSRWVPFRRAENPHLQHFLERHPWPRELEQFPQNLQQEMKDNDLLSVAPLTYRDKLLGFLAFKVPLQSLVPETLERISRRLAIILENEILRQKLPDNEALKKEFRTARRVQGFLFNTQPVVLGKYRLSFDRNDWEKKYFPALFETVLVPAAGKDKELFLVLLRLHRLSHRSQILQLFMLQGYFIALARKQRSLPELARSLQKILQEEEKGILAEGFLLKLSSAGKAEFQAFGRRLSFVLEEEEQSLPETTPIGSGAWPELFHVEKFGSLALKIQGYSLAKIESTER